MDKFQNKEDVAMCIHPPKPSPLHPIPNFFFLRLLYDLGVPVTAEVHAMSSVV